jgi:hypothetical protein
MGEKVIKIGDVFGYLEIIAERQQTTKRQSWLCECQCGKKLVIGRNELIDREKRRASKSCGCKLKAQNGLTTKNFRVYSTWYQMNKRCYDPTADNYERYGGKGVTVCEEWRESFEQFYDWAMANGYEKELTIDRIDPSKPYQPDNCRWADYFVQEQNRGLMKTNTTGYSGVTVAKDGKFIVNIKRRYIPKYLGTFPNLEEAIEARKKAERYYEEHGTIETYKTK